MLLIDAGNSRCKWARVTDGQWQQQGSLANQDSLAWQHLREKFALWETPQKIIVSNVAGRAIEERISALCSVWSNPVQFIVALSEQCGVRNSYEQPAQLGSDRWAALIAARRRVKKACLVVNCGTATTVDALSSEGTFLGGLILPGVEIMMQSLVQNTAQLTLGEYTQQDFPRHTAAAIANGALLATTTVIRHQYALLATQGVTHCLISGGAAHLILPQLGLVADQVDNLVLHGLQIIGQQDTELSHKETVA
jgi:type III pantothenate kinase